MTAAASEVAGSAVPTGTAAIRTSIQPAPAKCPEFRAQLNLRTRPRARRLGAFVFSARHSYVEALAAIAVNRRLGARVAARREHQQRVVRGRRYERLGVVQRGDER